jgi:hypothetical protein
MSRFGALVLELAQVLRDYREGTPQCVTPDRVAAWINQFRHDDREIILSEMVHIFRRFYVSRAAAEQALASRLEKLIREEAGGDPRRFVEESAFLSIQTDGASQHEMVALIDDILQLRYGVHIVNRGDTECRRFVYVDDAIYTGNTILGDLVNWSPTTSDRGWMFSDLASGHDLHIFVLIVHLADWRNYVRPRITNVAKERAINLRPDAEVVVHNNRWEASRFECLWPSSDYDSDDFKQHIESLREELREKGVYAQLLRPPGVPREETLFTSPQAREVVERAFLLHGLELWKGTRRPWIRPLGFSKLVTLGFGTLAIPYRNCPNNAPLVLWWSAGGWQPLLQRYDPY